MEIYTRTRKYDKEAIDRIQEKHRKEREEFDKKAEEDPTLVQGSSIQSDDSTFSPKSPRYASNSWEEDDSITSLPEYEEGPTYNPESPRGSPTLGEEGEHVGISDEEPEDPSAELIQLEDLDNKTVSQHRKAFVNWVNNVFYERIKDLNHDSPLKIYQTLVQQYLSYETPYRGLLVYHGLGTGKTATAISLAEGLRGQMRINTLLPASLETNFIGEIMGDKVKGKMGWGKDELNIDNNWSFVKISEIDDDFKDSYKLDGKVLRIIQNETVRAVKQYEDKELEKRAKSIRGFFIPDKNGTKYEDLEQEQQEFLKKELEYLIKTKYNFIHYNPFPKVKTDHIKTGDDDKDDAEEDEDLYLLDEEQKKKVLTNNMKIVKDLEKRLKYNKKNFNVDSPFYGECVVIDEVHNFVREILNPASKPSKVFYEWIVNAENVKLVFLSGTPVINKPSEIAVLYNMLKGLIKIYTFTIKSDLNVEDVIRRCNEVFYKNPSLIELFYVEKKMGKIVISFIQERTGFESLMDPNDKNEVVYTVQSKKEDFEHFNVFINEIYDGLHEIFDEEDIVPSKETYNDLSPRIKSGLLRGKHTIYDKELNIVFNRKQKLFDILEDDVLTDMTNNDNFMRYFFEGRDEIPEIKRILMKRMLMGLTSYYPIDRSSIVDMPIVVDPEYLPIGLENHKIVQKLNVVPCMMSQTQFEKYMEMWSKEKSIDALARMRGYDEDSPFHYHMRTRQSCNIVYLDDDFRTTKKTEDNKGLIEDMKAKAYQKILDDNSLGIDKDLKNLSPKMFQIMNNINKFMKDGKPTGKILFYSDFRSDGGSEAFELVLKSNGYQKFDTKDPQKEKGKRYTFITGSEGPEERSVSKEYFNDETNKHGEYIQIMIISSAGAEGISLTCVRQVHILEPFWNYVRIDQVLGRAIRMRSHTQLPKEDRNVEQYLYLSTLPRGDNLESVYKSLKADENHTWLIPEFTEENIKVELNKPEYKDFKEVLDSIIRVNVDTGGESADNHLFEIMERKYRVSLEINSVIKESSLDCIQHTRDDPELNDKCIRFSDKLSGEIAYFPGISAKVLENIDIVQLKAKYLYHIKPNVYVISASNDEGNNLFIYYEYLSTEEKEPDIRYIREKGRRLCDVYIDSMMILNYVDKEHPYNKRLGKEFSVYQEMYTLDDDVIDEYISQDEFPPLKQLLVKDSLKGYKLKYNVNDTFYYMGLDSILPDICIQRVYPYQLYIDDNYKIDNIPPRVIYNGELFINV
uniref:Helicase C-terminal domain-containing protein n=1 Tax=viral metagenome TaxID=1070528 RepID=A0A6C0FEL7_9ZZZZ|tara:strand:+ start:8408 stop:12148 length:3741 start_codon:yes stop_codon:yes gene_type:complete